MIGSLNWNFTAKQYLAFAEVVANFTKQLNKQKKPPQLHIYQLVLLKLQKNMSAKTLYAGYYPNVNFKLKLDYISAITFYECCTFGMINTLTETSLEMNVASEVCRDIHQKILSK